MMKEMEQRMIAMVNDERVNRGLGPLTPSDQLCEIARLHSNTQLRYGSIFHVSPSDGSDHQKRMQRAGYFSRSCAENVATSPTLIMSHKGLMNSPGHYKNIVGDFREIGIGITTGRGQLYITQLFAVPVRLIDISRARQEMLKRINYQRNLMRLTPLIDIESDILNESLKNYSCDDLDVLFDRILDELHSKGIHYGGAVIQQFTGFENPYSEDQKELIAKDEVKAISFGISQDTGTGMLKGVFLFFSQI